MALTEKLRKACYEREARLVIGARHTISTEKTIPKDIFRAIA
jgi:hypothetical protein